MKYKQWNRAASAPQARAAMEAAGVPPLAALTLCARGLDTPEKASAFLDAGRGQLLDPFLMKDMDRAAARVRRALAAGEHIAVYGDYDVDGITSTCLLTDFLRREGGTVIPYIPDRMEEGYGLNREAVAALRGQGVGLIVTVDCGITAVEEAACAASLGVELVITDHHECKAALPAAAAVVDPRRADCPYPFKCLAGVGVALKLVLALGGPARQDELLARYADLAAIGTVADVMSLTGENRTIVRLGLEALRRTGRPGLRALLHEAGLDERPLTATAIGYTLAPRINASGRMGCASLAGELLLTDDPARGEELSRALCDLNRERQAIEAEIYTECQAMAEALPQPQRHALVLAGEQWHQGVVGIVASRLAEKYSCPAFMICLQDGKGKGSCRSFAGFNLFAALERCAPLLEGFGGHALAAGFTIREENIPAFAAAMYRRGGDGFRPGHRRGAGRCGPAHPGGSGGPGAAGALRRGQPKAGVLPVWLPGFRRERGGRRAAPEAEADRVRPVVRRHFLLGHRRGGRGGAGRPGGRGFHAPDQRVPGVAERPAPALRSAPRPHPGPGRAGPVREVPPGGAPHPAGGGGPAAQPGGVRHPVALPEGPRGAGPAGGHGPPPGPQHRPLRRPAGDGDAHPGVPGGL